MFKENKGTDQLSSYCGADLRLCFLVGKKPFFSQGGSYEPYCLVLRNPASRVSNKNFDTN